MVTLHISCVVESTSSRLHPKVQDRKKLPFFLRQNHSKDCPTKRLWCFSSPSLYIYYLCLHVHVYHTITYHTHTTPYTLYTTHNYTVHTHTHPHPHPHTLTITYTTPFCMHVPQTYRRPTCTMTPIITSGGCTLELCSLVN